MKIRFIFFTFFVFVLTSPSLPLLAEEVVLESNCAGGGEFGNIVTFKFSRNYRYGKLTIKRSAANSDYTRDLSEFQGGNYRLDLNPRGGITGYALEYGPKDSDQMSSLQNSLSCSKATAPAEATKPTITPPPPPPPSSEPEPTPEPTKEESPSSQTTSPPPNEQQTSPSLEPEPDLSDLD